MLGSGIKLQGHKIDIANGFLEGISMSKEQERSISPLIRCSGAIFLSCWHTSAASPPLQIRVHALMAIARIFTTVLLCAMVVFFVLFTVVGIYSYTVYRDAGTMTTRGLTLMVVNGPLAILTLSVTMILASWWARRRQLSLWLEFVSVCAALSLVAVANFGLPVWMLRDYPCPEPCGVIHFLTDGTPRIADN